MADKRQFTLSTQVFYEVDTDEAADKIEDKLFALKKIWKVDVVINPGGPAWCPYATISATFPDIVDSLVAVNSAATHIETYIKRFKRARLL